MRVPFIALQEFEHRPISESLVRRAWSMLNDESYLLLGEAHTAFQDLPRTWEAIRSYFAQPVAIKMSDYIGHSVDHHGYVPMGEEGAAGEAADYKESFDCGWSPPTEGHDPNYWPQRQSRFRVEVPKTWSAMRALGSEVARLASRLLREDEGYLATLASRPPSQLRLLHYPGDNTERVGVDWHTDYECFTLLITTQAGLEVRRRDGSTASVPYRPGSVVVTVGDLFEVLTNGGLCASEHRVRPLEQERYSIAFFYALDWDATVEPLPQFVGAEGSHYPALVAGDHLLRRTNAGFAYRRSAITAPADSGPVDGAASPYFFMRQQ